MATYLFSGSRNPAAILLSSSHLFLVSIISLSSPFEAVFRYHSTPHSSDLEPCKGSGLHSWKSAPPQQARASVTVSGH